MYYQYNLLSQALRNSKHSEIYTCEVDKPYFGMV